MDCKPLHAHKLNKKQQWKGKKRRVGERCCTHGLTLHYSQALAAHNINTNNNILILAQHSLGCISAT